MQGAWRETRSQVSRIRPGLKAVLNHWATQAAHRALFFQQGEICDLGQVMKPGFKFSSAKYKLLKEISEVSFCFKIHRFFLTFYKRFYLFIWETESEWERVQAGWGIEGEADWAGSPSSQDSRIMTWVRGRCLTDWATQAPHPPWCF